MISIIDRPFYNCVEYMALIRISCNIVIWLDNLMQILINIIVNTHWGWITLSLDLPCKIQKKRMYDRVVLSIVTYSGN